MMAAPVADSPVKAMAFTSGWLTSASPVESGPKPCTRLNTPGGTPTLLHDLREQRGTRGGLLGGLGDHRVAADQRRRHLPGQQQERQIPRRDHRHHADGLVHRVVERAAAVGGAHLEALGGARQREIRIGAEVRRAARDVEPARLRERLAGVGNLGAHELREALLDAIGHLAQQRAALGRVSRPHGPRSAARAACTARSTSAASASVTVHEHAAVHRVDVLEAAAGAGELTADETGQLRAREGVRVARGWRAHAARIVAGALRRK